MKLPKLEISQILQQDVKEIFSSREKSKVIHGTKDIDASGDEVENSVRKVLRRKLPIKYYVSQGHIVDETLNSSSQLDIIIADNSGSPVLFTSENGTEYFPYESVYSIGEIKSTYYEAKNYIEQFINTTQNIYAELKREATPPEQYSQDFALEFRGGLTITKSDQRPFKNPLFKFIVFVDSNDFKLDAIKKLFNETDDKYLPNVICFLDKGIIVKTQIVQDNNELSQGPIELFPEFIKEEDKDKFEWVFLESNKDINKEGSYLAFLIFALNHHLKKCLVMRPNILKYFNGMFLFDGSIIK